MTEVVILDADAKEVGRLIAPAKDWKEVELRSRLHQLECQWRQELAPEDIEDAAEFVTYLRDRGFKVAPRESLNYQVGP